MNGYGIKLIFIFLSNIPIMVAASSRQQGKVQQWISRQVTLPIQLHNGVPYLQLSLLCQAEIKEEVSGNKNLFDLRTWGDERDSQFEEINNYYQQSDVTVMLDTGSSQFWLADAACSNCHSKKSLCPHLLTSQKKITYVKGYIEGVDSYINLCGNRMKFLCVKAAEGLGQLAFQGIMGLKKDSLGFNMLFTILTKAKTRNLINQQSPSKYPGRNYIILHKQQIKFTLLGRINQLKLKISKLAYQKNYEILKVDPPIKDGIKMKEIICNQNWSFRIKQISLFNDAIMINQNQETLKQQSPKDQQKNNKASNMNKRQINAYADTGSTKVVLSNTLCQQIINETYQKLNIQCRYQQGEGIDCNRIIEGFNFKMGIGTKSKVNQGKQIETQYVQVSDEHLIDRLSNRINIICQPSTNQIPTKQTPQTIILGYPFFKSHETTFVIESVASKQNKQDKDSITYKIRLESYSRQQIGNQKWIIIAMVVIYICSVGILSWATLVTIDFIRDKRSKKIII